VSGLVFEWDYFPSPDGEPFIDKAGNEILGWHDRHEDQDPDALLTAFEAYFHDFYSDSSCSLTLRPVLARWEEGTFVCCTSRAKHPQPMWQIEVTPKGQDHD
jgi:hypothetical protein